jgi:hypothetical protein
MKRHDQTHKKVVYRNTKKTKIETLYDGDGRFLSIPEPQEYILFDDKGHYDDDSTKDLKLAVTHQRSEYYTWVAPNSPSLFSYEHMEDISLKRNDGRWVRASIFSLEGASEKKVIFTEGSGIRRYYPYNEARIKSINYLDELSKLENKNKYIKGQLIRYTNTDSHIDCFAKIINIKDGQVHLKMYDQKNNCYLKNWEPLNSDNIKVVTDKKALFDYLFNLHKNGKKHALEFILKASDLSSDLNLFTSFFDQYCQHAKQENSDDYLMFMNDVVEGMPQREFNFLLEQHIRQAGKDSSLKAYAIDSKNADLSQKILEILILENNNVEHLKSFFSKVVEKGLLNQDKFDYLLRLTTINGAVCYFITLNELSIDSGLSIEANKLSDYSYRLAENIIANSDFNQLEQSLSPIFEKKLLTEDDFYRLLKLTATKEREDISTSFMLLALGKENNLTLDQNRLADHFYAIAKDIIINGDPDDLKPFLLLAQQRFPDAMLGVDAYNLEKLCIRHAKQNCLDTLLDLHEKMLENNPDFSDIRYEELKRECDDKHLRTHMEIRQVRYNKTHLDDTYMVEQIARHYKPGFFSKKWQNGADSIRDSTLSEVVAHALDNKPHLISFFGSNNRTYEAVERATGKTIKPSKDLNDALHTVRHYFMQNV